MRKLFPVLLISSFLFACSASENLTQNLQVEMINYQIHAWLNLMPGSSPGTFHLTGEITLKNNGSDKLDSLGIEKLIVYCDSEEVYVFKPSFKTNSTDENYSLASGSSKKFTFGTEKGLKVNETINKSKRIDIKLDLKTNSGGRYFKIRDIKVERTY